jgi:hypothetical protein
MKDPKKAEPKGDESDQTREENRGWADTSPDDHETDMTPDQDPGDTSPDDFEWGEKPHDKEKTQR